MYLVREELDFVITQTEKEFCILLRFTDPSGKSTDTNIPVTNSERVESLEKILEGLSIGKGKAIRPQEGRMNIEKQRLYCKASAKVLYTITICIDLIDIDLIGKTATAKGV